MCIRGWIEWSTNSMRLSDAIPRDRARLASWTLPETTRDDDSETRSSSWMGSAEMPMVRSSSGVDSVAQLQPAAG